MNTFYRNSLFLLCIIFFCVATGCSPKNSTYKDADEWIPQSFNPNTGTLLISYHPLGKKQNDRMIEFISKNYPYAFEVVESINNEKYADKNKYPFVIKWKTKSSQNYGMSSNGKAGTNYAWDMFGYFLDRVEDKNYPTTGKTNPYGQIGYRPVINSITKKFKGK